MKPVIAAAITVLGGLILAGCASSPEPPPPMAAPAPAPALPASFPAQDLVGRWGLAAFHKPEDQERTEAAAANQCRQPYIISMGPTGGVMMHLADQATPEELRLKGSVSGKNYIGPEGEAGGMQDREVVSFNGRVMILKFVDPEVHGRYGNMVYVRCAPEGAKRPAPRRPAAAKPAAKPAAAAKPVPKPAAR